MCYPARFVALPSVFLTGFLVLAFVCMETFPFKML